MIAVFKLSTPSDSWLTTYFNSFSPYLLPILGKPLIEFYIDYCSLCGVTQILLIQEDFYQDINYFVKDGSKWGIEIKKGLGTVSDTFEKIVETNKLSSQTEVLFFEDFFFPLYNKSTKRTLSPQEISQLKKIHLISIQNNSQLPYCEEIIIDSILRYYNLNMELLTQYTNQLMMKGYGAEAGVFMGMNDVIARRTELLPPFIIGDNVQINSDVQIGKNTIIGDTCIIDHGSVLTDTIIFNKTYVGFDLNLSKKIVYENNIIDPINNVFVQLQQNIISKLEGNLVSQWGRQIIVSTLSAFCILFMMFPFLLFKLTGLPKHKWITYRKSNGSPCSKQIPIYEENLRLKNAWFFRLSLDKFHLLFHAMCGKIYLIGDTLWDHENQARLLAKYRDYHPGAFSYSDSISTSDEAERIISDHYYKHNRSLKTDTLLIFKAFFRRLFYGKNSK